MARRYPRYPASIPCVIEGGDGIVFEAVIIDLSAGGAGIEVGGDVGTLASFELLILDEQCQFRLPCQVRQVRDVWDRRVIHIEFSRHGARATAQLADLLERLRGESGYRSSARGGWLRRILRRLIG